MGLRMLYRLAGWVRWMRLRPHAGLFGHGGHSSGAYTSGQGATPCACGNGNAAGVTGAPYPVGGQFITSEGPQMTSPIYMPGANGAGQPPRIVTVPQAHPTPYTP